MSSPTETIATTTPTIRAGITANGQPLPADIESRVRRVVVDNDLNLPGMFEVTFLDVGGGTTAEAGITIGTLVTVAGPEGSGETRMLIEGEVTAIEGALQGVTMRTVVRGYTTAHRLQRARRSRSFVNVTDADVARQIAQEAGLAVGNVVATSTTHSYLAQVNQTDWEFLTARSQEIGFEMGVADGQFYFRPAADNPTAAGGGLEGVIRSVVADATSSAATTTVEFPDTLISFRPRVSAGNLTPEVEVRVWDPMARTALAQRASTPDATSPSAQSLGAQFTSGGLASQLGGGLRAAAGAAAAFSSGGVAAGLDTAMDAIPNAMSQATGGLLGSAGGLFGSPVGYLGPAPSPTAHVVADRPVADTTTMATTGPMVAGAVGSAFGSTFAECEGEAKGNAAIQPNAMVDVQGVQNMFAGIWQVSRARHIFDDSEYGYRVIFSAHGRQDRTMLGLTSKGGRSSTRNSALDGVVCGVVSDCADPLGRGRIKMTLPWLSPDFETDWAPNIQFCSGPRSGAIFMPEIGDEVLLAFEFGDIRRPYVLGAMMNNLTRWSIAQSGPIFAGGLPGLSTEVIGVVTGAIGAGVGTAVGASVGTTVGTVAGFAVGGPVGAGVGAQFGLVGGAIAGNLIGHEVGRAVGTGISNEVIEGAQTAAGMVLTPGMVSEVQHRGFVSSTGNALVFYDVPMIPPLSAAADGGLAGVGGLSQGAGDIAGDVGRAAGSKVLTGVAGGAGELAKMATGPAGGIGALGSAVRLGSQNGEMGITVDQVNGGVNVTASPVPGVTVMPVPNINITANNGFVNLSAGPEGTMLIDGGMNLIIKSGQTITLDAAIVNIVGLPLVNGVPIPL